MSQDDEKRGTTGYVGWAMHGLYIVGTVSFLSGIAVLLMLEDVENDYKAIAAGVKAIGAGVCWIASGISFGLLLNGLARR